MNKLNKEIFEAINKDYGFTTAIVVKSYLEGITNIKINREQNGCDVCRKDSATEKFIGHCGNVFYICSNCQNRMLQEDFKLEGKANE